MSITVNCTHTDDKNRSVRALLFIITQEVCDCEDYMQLIQSVLCMFHAGLRGAEDNSQ